MLVEKMRGRIDVKSTPNKGTTFIIIICAQICLSSNKLSGISQGNPRRFSKLRSNLKLKNLVIGSSSDEDDQRFRKSLLNDNSSSENELSDDEESSSQKTLLEAENSNTATFN